MVDYNSKGVFTNPYLYSNEPKFVSKRQNFFSRKTKLEGIQNLYKKKDFRFL